MKKKPWLTVLIFNIFALPLLILGVVFMILENFGTEIYFCGQMGGTAELMCLSFGVTLEGILFVVLAILRKKWQFILPDILLIPLVLIMVFIGYMDYSDVKEIKLEKSGETLIVENSSFLMSGGSTVYEKTSAISGRLLDSVYGDEGFEPLKDPDTYVIKEYDNGIIIECEDGNGNKQFLYLAYENGRFSSVEEMDFTA